MQDLEYDVTIIGAGVSGLRAAHELDFENQRVLIIEKTNKVGGRVKTYNQDGFSLDRGFQILLTAYPELRDVLDLDRLNIQPFMSGAHIRIDGQFKSLIDPLSHPISGFLRLLNQVGSIRDKWRLFRLRRTLKKQSIDEIFEKPEKTTNHYLRDFGFSKSFVEKFFRPFFSGIFLENELKTSSRMFEFVFKMFAEGDAVLPADGIQSIPNQMASELPDDCFMFNRAVSSVENQTIHLDQDTSITSEVIIDARSSKTESSPGDNQPHKHWNGTNCYYFEVDQPPTDDPILYINGSDGSINNLCFPNVINETYSDPERHLLSVSTLQTGETVGDIKDELQDWFGNRAQEWQLIGRYEIDEALPCFEPPTNVNNNGSFKIRDGLYRIGDITTTPSLNGALKSGRIIGQTVSESVTPAQ